MIEDHQIITELQKGNHQAISWLYDKYADALYGVTLKILNDEEMAQDVIQDVMIKVWKNRSQYNRQKGKLFTWLLNITRNKAIDSYRSRSTRREGKNRFSDSLVSTSKSYQLNPDQIGLHAMVGDLDPKYKEVIDLIYFRGFTHSEAHEHLNIPLGTIKTRLRKALLQLRDVFDAQLILPILAMIFTV